MSLSVKRRPADPAAGKETASGRAALYASRSIATALQQSAVLGDRAEDIAFEVPGQSERSEIHRTLALVREVAHAIEALQETVPAAGFARAQYWELLAPAGLSPRCDPPKYRGIWDRQVERKVIDPIEDFRRRQPEITMIAACDLDGFMYACERSLMADWTGDPAVGSSKSRIKRLFEDEYSLRFARLGPAFGASAQAGRRLQPADLYPYRVPPGAAALRHRGPPPRHGGGLPRQRRRTLRARAARRRGPFPASPGR